jgi:hypothetical protein
MGLLDFLKKEKPRSKSRPHPQPVQVIVLAAPPRVVDVEPTPSDLRQKLFAAAVAGDEDKLAFLCQCHEKSIYEQGVIWANVPPPIRANPTLLRWYGTGLKTIATFCAHRLGKPELVNKIKQFDVAPAAAANTDSTIAAAKPGLISPAPDPRN